MIEPFLAIYRNFFRGRNPVVLLAILVFAAMLTILAFAQSIVVGLLSLFLWVVALPAMIYLIDSHKDRSGLRRRISKQ